MQKLTSKIAGIPEDGTYFSLEFFPPKTQMVGNTHRINDRGIDWL